MRPPGIRGAAAALVLPASLLLAPAAEAGPRIRLQGTSADYGKVPIERIVRHRFRYQNAGDAPLRITNRFCHANFITTKALEGCWPPHAVVGATTLRPGEASFVQTSFTMHKGMEGPHHFLIVLETNDPENRTVELHIKADFVSP